MGLDTSHGAWHGPYSSFNRFRYWLAEKIGINLNDYIGYGDNAQKELTSIDHKLMPLFNHSDCEGELTPSECKQIAEGIEDAIKDEPEDLPENEYSFSNLNKAKQFKEGCLLAYSLNENIEFN